MPGGPYCCSNCGAVRKSQSVDKKNRIVEITYECSSVLKIDLKTGVILNNIKKCKPFVRGEEL